MSRFVTTILSLAAFSGALIAVLGWPPGAPTAPPARSGAMESLEFWSEARSYPENNIAPDKYTKAFEWAKQARLKRRLPALDGSGWNYIGPANLSGRMLAIALNPQNPNTIYAGSASGGLWRSYTGGVEGDWERVPTGYPVLGVAAIAIDPGDSNVIYIGTGEVYRYAGTAGGLVVRTTRGSYGMGILKSTDGGANWSKSLDWSYNQQRGVQALRLNPLNASTVWAATTEGIYRSTDAGGSWTNELALQMGQDIVIHPVDTLKMLVSTGNLGLSNYVVRTTDGGAIWIGSTPKDFSGKTLLAQYQSNPDIVFASVADSTTGVGSLWRTDDFGGAWTEVSNSTTNAIFGVQGWYSHFVAVHPDDSSIVFHAGVPARRSTNGGVTFSGVGGTYSDHHAYAYDPTNPDILYVANDDGIYRSTNFGSSFTKVSVNLGTGQFYNGFSNSASDSLIALGQVQDHIPGYLYQGSPTWPLSAVDEVGWTAIDQTNDFIMYAGTRDGGSVRKSTNRGVSFGATGGGFSGLSCWNAPFVLSPSNPNVLYFGRSRIFKSTNAAATWVATNGGSVLDGNPALSMAVSATDPDVVYVGTAPRVDRTHIFRTTDGGTTWADVTGPLPDRHPLDIAVDPLDPSTAYVGYGGYGTGHVFKTTDAGASWTDITGTLPDIPVTALLVDPANSAVVYLGSDVGVVISTNGGGTWEPLNDGLPEALLVSDLSMTPSNRTLRASTHGNSVWERKMPTGLPSLAGVVPAGGETWNVGSVRTISWAQTLVSTVSIDYSTDDGATWIPVAASVPAWPDSFQWSVPPTPTTLGRVRVRSGADTLLGSQSAGPFSITFEGVILDLDADWNLLSVPMEVPDSSRGALFPASLGKAYRFDGSYAAVETLETGRGYWLKLPAPELHPVGGDSIFIDTLAGPKGWVLLGSISSPVAASSVVTVPPGLIVSPFFGYDGSYSTDDTVRPGRGYWVKLGGPGLVILDATAPPSSAPATVNGTPPPGTGTLRFSDAGGRSASLRLTQRPGDHPAVAELPPLPPAGGFDVRFPEGSFIAVADDGAHPIRTQGLRLPVIVSWELPAGESYLFSPGDGSPIRLAGTGSVELGSIRGASIRRTSDPGGVTPDAFSLDRNYPNPFNPVTQIRFVIPGDGTSPDGSTPNGTVAASLTIYDVAGREAGRLIDGGVTPGAHTVEWNAQGSPAGVYFCVLRSGGRSLSMKMLLVK